MVIITINIRLYILYIAVFVVPFQEEVSRTETLSPELSILFDVVYPTSVGSDTSVEIGDLSLTQGQDYHILVLAMDQSGGMRLGYRVIHRGYHPTNRRQHATG